MGPDETFLGASFEPNFIKFDEYLIEKVGKWLKTIQAISQTERSHF